MNPRSNAGHRFYNEHPRINHTEPLCYFKNRPAALEQCDGVAIGAHRSSACALLQGLDSAGISPTGVTRGVDPYRSGLGWWGRPKDGVQRQAVGSNLC
jgi:hypothetical protein